MRYIMKLFVLTTGLLMFCLGIWQLYAFSTTPGDHTVVQSWILQDKLPLKHQLASLVVLIHPKCSCSTATLKEVERLKIGLKDKLDVKLVFISYGDKSKNWYQGPVWDLAVSMKKNVSIVLDNDGQILKTLGTKTSGTAYLVGPDLKVVFQGGLTPIRGHEGATSGQAFIASWVKGNTKSSLIQKIFGCGV